MSDSVLIIARRGAFAATLIATFVGLLPSRATAVATEVFPGAGTLQAAIDASAPHDTLKLHQGTYTGAVVVNKQGLKLKALVDSNPGPATIIDGGCAAAVALDVAADDVQIDGQHLGIDVLGGTASQVRVADHKNVKLRGVIAEAGAAPCGGTQNGIEVSGTSAKIELMNSQGRGLSGAGVYLNGLAVGAGIQLKHAGKAVVPPGGQDNGVGLLVQDSAGGAALGKSGIQIKGGEFVGNTVAGVRLVNSDGLRIKKNTVQSPSGGAGAIGIELDASSDANLVTSNMWISGNVMDTAYIDNGTGNCARKNTFPDSCP